MPRAGELCPLLKNALDRLLPYQVADTGMFLQVVDRADLTGNYSETSGSAAVAPVPSGSCAFFFRERCAPSRS